MRLANAKQYIQSFQKLTDKYLEISCTPPFKGLDFNPTHQGIARYGPFRIYVEIDGDICNISMADHFIMANVPIVNGTFTLYTYSKNKEVFQIKNLVPMYNSKGNRINYNKSRR